jgi:hypothetical protein
MGLIKWDELQLKFDLPLDEVEFDATERMILPDEAKSISLMARRVLEAKLEAENWKVSWFEDYARLLENGWPWRVAAYMAWASCPKVGRWPETLEKLATEVLGLASPRQIYNWRGKYKEIDTMVGMLQSAPLWEHRRDVIAALVQMAALPDYKSFNDRKLFLEMTRDYTPRSQLDVGKSAGNDLDGLSDGELREWLGEEPNPIPNGKGVKDGMGSDSADSAPGAILFSFGGGEGSVPDPSPEESDAE